MSANNCHTCGKQLSGAAKRKHKTLCTECDDDHWRREERDLKKQAQLDVDRNVEAVREKLLQRSIVGLKKYGVTTERDDLSRLDWLIHAQEEAMDLANYLEVLIQMEQSNAS
jgi:hypothetical protein